MILQDANIINKNRNVYTEECLKNAVNDVIDLFPADPDFDIKEPDIDWVVAGVSNSEYLKRCKEKIREIFDKDEQLKWGYILNVAMHLHDELCKDDVELKVGRRNEIAERLLKVIFYMGEK